MLFFPILVQFNHTLQNCYFVTTLSTSSSKAQSCHFWQIAWQDLGRTSRTFGNSAGHLKKMPENALKHPKTPIDTLKTLQMSFRTPYNPLKYLKWHVNPIILDQSEKGTLLSPSADLQWKLLSLGAVVQWSLLSEIDNCTEGQQFPLKVGTRW